METTNRPDMLHGASLSITINNHSELFLHDFDDKISSRNWLNIVHGHKGK